MPETSQILSVEDVNALTNNQHPPNNPYPFKSQDRLKQLAYLIEIQKLKPGLAMKALKYAPSTVKARNAILTCKGYLKARDLVRESMPEIKELAPVIRHNIQSEHPAERIANTKMSLDYAERHEVVEVETNSLTDVNDYLSGYENKRYV